MKNVIITGAGGNLGKAVTAKFLAEGYRVIATVSKESGKEAFAPHDDLVVEVINLYDEEAAARFVRSAIDTYGAVDAALLLVGGFAMGDLAATSMAAINDQINTNFATAYHVARPVFTHMMEKGKGRIVLIGSRPALEPARGRGMIAYSLSKSMLFHLAEYINESAKGKDVTATVVAPSTIDTPQNRAAMPGANPSQWVTPEALAETLAFIVSDKAAALREAVLKVYGNG